MGKFPTKFYCVVFTVGIVLLIILFLAGFTNSLRFSQAPYPSQVERIEKSVQVEPGGVTVTPAPTFMIPSPNSMFPNGYNIP